MVTGSMPYDDENIPATMQKQKKHVIDYPDSVVVAFYIKSIISGLLHPDVTRRTSVKQLLLHPWIN
jgi:testis-specific serine kinase